MNKFLLKNIDDAYNFIVKNSEIYDDIRHISKKMYDNVKWFYPIEDYKRGFLTKDMLNIFEIKYFDKTIINNNENPSYENNFSLKLKLKGNVVKEYFMSKNAEQSGVKLLDEKSLYYKENNELFKKFYVCFNKANNINNDKIFYLNNTFSNLSMFLYIPKNVTLDKPIFLDFEFDDDPRTAILSTLFIYMDECSECSIIKRIDGTNCTNEALFSESVIIDLQKDSKLNYFNLQQNTTCHILLQNSFCFLDDNSVLTQSEYIDKVFSSRIDDNVILKGNKAKHYRKSFAYLESFNKLNINSKHIHQNKNTENNVDYKTISCDNSHSVIQSLVDINKIAENTNSELNIKSIVLSKDASVSNIPKLNVSNKNVKSSHSSTISRISDDEIFYLNSRGLNEKEIKNMIIQSYVNDLILNDLLSCEKELLRNLIDGFSINFDYELDL
jgi:Fe-S cluster assembly scaffold protein SufB